MKEWSAKKYSENSNVQFVAATNFMKKITFQKRSNILDIGCGDGKITALIAKKNQCCQVHGIDRSKNMVEFAIDAHENGHPNLKFYKKDANNLILDEKYDLVFSSFALQWVENIRDLFSVLHASLTEHGKLCFIIPLDFSILLEKALTETITSSKWEKYFRDYQKAHEFRTAQNIKDLLEINNFAIEEIEQKNVESVFETRKELVDYIRTWLPHPLEIPLESRDEFTDDFMNKYLANPGIIRSDKVLFSFNTLEVISRKKEKR